MSERIRHLRAWLLTSARRRPRAAMAAAAIAIVLVVAGASAGFATVLRPAAADPVPPDGPTFTYGDGWSLVELQGRIAGGEVDAISAVPAAESGGAATLVARTRSGQVVAIDLSISAGEAVAALASLGHADLFTTEIATVPRPTTASATNGGPLVVLLPILTLGLLVFVVWRTMRRHGGAGRDASSGFMTIMPPAPAAVGARAGIEPGAGDASLDPNAIRLADVAGCDEAKLELTEAIEFLRTPERFRRLGARIPRGIMLYGPPGTGKTMLARAVAAEAGVPFHYASGSEFVEKYVGVGARRIRDLFGQARKLGRGVVFFDEFDALGKARGGPNSHEEREQTLNQLLVELDGFASTDDVIVIAATNRLDVLDPAVLRPGRFNRKIHVGLPDVAGRREILAVHARNKPLAGAVDLEETARKTYGFSGAQLADLLNEAAILAARRRGDAIEPEDLHAGWLKVAVGTSRRRSMDERERSIIAAHEVGHAICGRVHGDKRRVEEISLFAHGEALGVTVSSQEDNDLPSESDLRARLVALMGGRAAEEILFHEVTGGASNDFEAANRIATAMVTRWGMGRDPDAADGGASGRGVLSFLVPTGGRSLPSDVQAAATRAIRAILDEAYAEASRTLVEHLPTLRRLAAYLVEHERVDGLTFDELFDGRRPVPTADDEWRAATSRPRDWVDVVDLAAARRSRLPLDGGATVAASVPAAGLDDVPADARPPAVPALALDGPLGGPLAAPAPSPAGLEPAPLALTGPSSATTPRAPGRGTLSPFRLPDLGRSATRRLDRHLRRSVAGVLHRAETRLTRSVTEADRL